jgi:Bifunctional DNA primase/polymerase, N-terminal
VTTAASPALAWKTAREAAGAYIKRGFRVVPLYGILPEGGCACGSPTCKERDWGKHEPPETDGQWKDVGRVFAPAEFGEFDNIGICMGPWKDGKWLLALDLDGTDNVAEFFPAMPPTLTQQSPRGRHLIYTVPDYTPLGNYVDVFKTKRAGFSLDLRYARGRLVCAPSKGAAGDYTWIDWRTPAPLPNHCLATILHQRRTQKLPVAERWSRGSKDP